MIEKEELPQEIKCFVCLKLLTDYKIVLMCIRCKDSDVLVTVAVCNNDLIWLKENPDAGTAICQSRLAAILERDEKEHND